MDQNVHLHRKKAKCKWIECRLLLKWRRRISVSLQKSRLFKIKYIDFVFNHNSKICHFHSNLLPDFSLSRKQTATNVLTTVCTEWWWSSQNNDQFDFLKGLNPGEEWKRYTNTADIGDIKKWFWYTFFHLISIENHPHIGTIFSLHSKAWSHGHKNSETSFGI